jgi:uncharacterized protein (DUF433 family)
MKRLTKSQRWNILFAFASGDSIYDIASHWGVSVLRIEAVIRAAMKGKA